MLPTDLRLAWRTLRRSPLFLAVAIVILAVGTGGMATSFSVLDAFLLAPLPYRDADRLVHLYRTDPQTGADALRFSLPMVEELRSATGAMEALGAYSYGGANLAGGEGEPEHVMAAWLTTDLLALLGTDPALGRGFVAADGEASSPRVALLDWGLWRRRFGGRPEIVGETLHLDGEAHQVIGVMRSGFGFPYGEIRVWVPARPSDPAFTWGNQAFQPVARLAAGVARGEARAALETHYRQVEEARTGIEPDHGIRVVPLRQALLFLYDLLRVVFVLSLVANACVLLIICANLANLLLARALGRTRETAVRAALGASRRDLLRQHLAESAILVGAGGALGLLLAVFFARLAERALPEALFRSTPIAVDLRALAVTLLVAIAIAVAFAVLPALQAARIDVTTALRQGAGQAGGGGRASRLQPLLVSFQVFAAFTLLLGTVLMVRTLVALEREDLGFTTERVLTAGLHLPETTYPDDARVVAFQDRLLDRLRALPQVSQAALIDPLPLNFASYSLAFAIEGRIPERAHERLAETAYWASEGYFAALGLPLLEGRGFTPTDRADAPPVAVVSRSFAARYWPGESAVGKRLRPTSAGAPARPWATVVGVVADSKTMFAHEALQPIVYLPLAQRPRRATFLVLATTVDPQAALPTVREVVRSLDATLPLVEPRSMKGVVTASMLPWQGTAAGLVGLGLLALVLALVGVYGVVASAVATRAGEIGIRRALGARGADIARLVLAQSGKLVLVGLAGGALVAALSSRLLGGVLVGVNGLDPLTYLGGAALLLAAALLAILAPLLRAVRLDPVRALRSL